MVSRPNHIEGSGLPTTISFDVPLQNRSWPEAFRNLGSNNLLDDRNRRWQHPGVLKDHNDGGQSRPHKAALCRASNANLIIAPAASLGDVS